MRLRGGSTRGPAQLNTDFPHTNFKSGLLHTHKDPLSQKSVLEFLDFSFHNIFFFNEIFLITKGLVTLIYYGPC
jgi:hypothetical protein